MAKTITGTVASKKTDKTIIVSEQVRTTHPLYRKQYTITKRFMAHDENNEAKEGDKVVITESRPLSARKHFALSRVIERAGVRHTEQADDAVAEVTGQKAEQDQADDQAEESK